MHRPCCRSVPRLRWNSSISAVAPVGSRGVALYQKLYIQLKMLPRMGESVARNTLDWFEKNNKRKTCWILLVCLHCWTNDARSHKYQTIKVCSDSMCRVLGNDVAEKLIAKMCFLLFRNWAQTRDGWWRRKPSIAAVVYSNVCIYRV
jgi:hypothetical protein